MFLVRSAFWLSVVILLLPSQEGTKTIKLSDAQVRMTTTNAIVAAQSTMEDLSGFCVRNQTACETGKAALEVFISKAQFGASLLNEWVKDNSSADTATVKPLKQISLISAQGQIVASLAYDADRNVFHAKDKTPSQQTLTKEDLSPVWGGPAIKQRA